MPNKINTQIINLITYSRIIFENPKIGNLEHLIKCVDNALNNIKCFVFFNFLFEGISSMKLKSLMIKNIGIDRFIILFDNFIEKNTNELSIILNNILNINIKTNNEHYSLCLLDKLGNDKIIKLITNTYSQNIKLNLYEQIFNVYLNNDKIKSVINLLSNLSVKELNLIQAGTNTNTNISENLSFINTYKFLYHLNSIGDFNHQLFKNEIKQNNINSVYLLNIIDKISNSNSDNVHKNKLEIKASLLDSCVQGILSVIKELKSVRDIKVSLEERMCTKLLNSLFKKINDLELKELYNTEYVKTSLKISIECARENVEQLETIYLNKPINKGTLLYNSADTVGTFIEIEMINRDLKKTKQLITSTSDALSLFNRMTETTLYCDLTQQTGTLKHK